MPELIREYIPVASIRMEVSINMNLQSSDIFHVVLAVVKVPTIVVISVCVIVIVLLPFVSSVSTL